MDWKKPTRKQLALAAAALLLLAAGAFAWQRLFGAAAMPEGLLLANGRIEGDHVAVAGKLAGRIAELKVREGDAVSAGQVLARLDDEQVSARLGQARAAVEAADAQHHAAETALHLLRQQVPLQIASADAALGQAQATQRKAEAAQAQAERDAARMQELAAHGTVPRQRAELAQLAATSAAADTAASRSGVARARQGASEARLGDEQVRARQAEVDAAAAGLQRAQATLQEVQSVYDDLTIRAPQSGMIVTRIRDAGEVVAAGAPLFDLVDLDRLYLKVYVPETQIGKIRRGLPARVYTDAFPAEDFAASVRYIASQAEFTPKEVQTTDERVKLTYAVKLYFEQNPQHRLTPGLPADAVIRWNDQVPWQRPRW